MNTIGSREFKFGLGVALGTVFCLGLAGTSLAQEPSTPLKAEPSLELKISDGKVSGTVDNRPVIEVLNLLSRKGLFKFRINEDLAQYRVSAKFEQASLVDSLKQILKPFNTLLLSNKEGNPETIFVLNLRSGDPSEGPAVPVQEAAIPGSKKSSREGAQFLSLDNLDLTDEQRAAFEVAGKKRGPPPDMMDLFYPHQDPGTEKTGPRAPMDYEPPDFLEKALSFDEAELTEEQRAAFGITKENRGPPPELFDQFYPKQLPDTFKTGPPPN